MEETEERSRFNETQVVATLKEKEAGKAVSEICREHGISNATYYAWKSKYSGMDASELKWIRQPEEENGRLKKIYADLIENVWPSRPGFIGRKFAVGDQSLAQRVNSANEYSGQIVRLICAVCNQA